MNSVVSAKLRCSGGLTVTAAGGGGPAGAGAGLRELYAQVPPPATASNASRRTALRPPWLLRGAARVNPAAGSIGCE